MDFNFEIDFSREPLVDISEQDDHDFPHPLQSGVMPLILTRSWNGAVYHAEPLGSAFAIGAGIFATARHVFDPVLRQEGAVVESRWHEDTEIFAVFVTTDVPPGSDVPYVGGPLKIMKVVGDAEHDLAVFTVIVPTTRDGSRPTFTLTSLTVVQPQIGSQLLAIGYPGSRTTVAGDDRIQLYQPLTASTGTVEEIFPVGRDKVMVRFPAMQGNYPSPHGMSGGPVIAENGGVCGIVCSGLEPDADGSGGWTSTCSLVANLFATRLELDLDGDLDGQAGGPYRLIDLAARGVIAADGSQEVLRSAIERLG